MSPHLRPALLPAQKGSIAERSHDLVLMVTPGGALRTAVAALRQAALRP